MLSGWKRPYDVSDGAGRVVLEEIVWIVVLSKIIFINIKIYEDKL